MKTDDVHGEVCWEAVYIGYATDDDGGVAASFVSVQIASSIIA
jgi:hypothetical protein